MDELKKKLEKIEDIADFIGEFKFSSYTVYIIYGDSLTGKTYICTWLSDKAINKGKNVLYIGTENKFSDRIYSWSKKGFFDLDEFLSNNSFHFCNPSNLGEFRGLINKLDKIVEENNIDVLIVDTIINPYNEINHSKKRAKKVGKAMTRLRNLTKEYNLLTVISTQSWKDNTREKPRGGKSLLYDSDHRIRLRTAKDTSGVVGSKRIVTFDRQKEFIISINKEGEIVKK